MELNFRTKEASKRAQEKEFLKRTGAERFQEFLRLMYQMKDFPSQYEKDKKGNFTIVIHTNKDGRLEP
ncbi:MAG: hypothetical protein ACPGQR_07860 [Marinirhabdus sp.]